MEMEEYLFKAYPSVRDRAKAQPITWRQAAYLEAMQRVVRAVEI